MSVNARWKVPLWLAAIALGAAGAYVALETPSASDAPGAAVPSAPAPASAPPSSSPHALPGVAGAVPLVRDGGLDLVGAAVASAPPQSPSDNAAPAPSPVDLERIRAKLPPDNLFWEMGAPTQDPEVLRKRAEAEHQWNELFGRVQSGEATEADIHRYFDYRRKLSEDYISVARSVLSEYGDALPLQERGLYELSIKMHTTRLEEMPRKEEEALARRELQARRQREWKQGGGGGN